AVGNNFGLVDGEEAQKQLADMRAWIDYAALMGAPVIRIFAGTVPKGETEQATIERCIRRISQSLEYAAQKGVFLALENHGGITSTSEQMLKIIRGVNESPWFGVNFDSGNFRTAEPYADLEKIAPYAINAQIKLSMAREGQKEEADLERVIGILRSAGYRGYVVLEYEEKDEPRDVIPKVIARLRQLTA
ncbi:MAG: sugar phosphate isomerase/epimerase, partial [Planctomycetaceae bacterium]|nr:sugar phosphate isomerase/epimerase [Planctomycetaceae bacterium]